MNLANANYFYVSTDVSAIGQNSEMADMSNPKGYIYGVCARVMAEDPNGYRWIHFKGFTSRDEKGAVARAEALLTKIKESTKALDDSYWSSIDPLYGSAAYIAERCEQQQIAREENEMNF